MDSANVSMNALAPDELMAALDREGGPALVARLLAANDVLWRGSELGNGRAIATARTAIYTDLVAHWAAEQVRERGYDRPFAVVALGGTGRGELTPCSDLDFAFLFDDVIDGNPFLLELQRQVLHSGEFQRRFGFGFEPLPFNLEDIPRLDGKQLNSFLDLRAVHDPGRLAERFRERLRATFDPFEHFLHVQGVWRDQWEKSAREYERLDRFDIKNEGLRVFLAGIWTLAGKTCAHSHDVYRTLEDPRDLAAFDFLLRIRGFIHTRRTVRRRPTLTGNHVEDVLGFEDFLSFGELLDPTATDGARAEFANDVRARLLAARRRVAQFTNGILGRELRLGRVCRPGSPLTFGVGGLRHVGAGGGTPREKSSAALTLLLAAQAYGVPIDRAELQGTFRNAGDWLVPVPELSALFYERRGSLAGSFEFLSQMDGAVNRLFPGYAQFEVSLDERVLTERRVLRSALEREKMRALETFLEEGRALSAGPIASGDPSDPLQRVSVAAEAVLLDGDHLAAVKLALKTKRLPVVPGDHAGSGSGPSSGGEQFPSGFSGIPLDDYYRRVFAECDFTPETLRVARFLVAHRRIFKDYAPRPKDARLVREFLALCPEEALLRALFVFTCADRAVWESETSDPARWFNIRELYGKARMQLRPGHDPTHVLSRSGYSAAELAILKDFGEDFFSGVYRHYANRFGAHLVRLAQDPELSTPKATILREGALTIVGIAARDFRGLAACISATFWRLGIGLRQAHLFSAASHGLALDFFHLAPGSAPVGQELVRALEEAIQRHDLVGPDDATGLRAIADHITLEEWRPNLLCLRAETRGDVGALICVLTWTVFHLLGGDVFGLTADSGRTGGWVSVYHSLPPGRTVEEARELLRARF